MKLRVVNRDAVREVVLYLRESPEYTFEKLLRSKQAWIGAEEATGTNMKVKCPFHADKTASMLFDEDNDRWHCFSCDKGGKLLDLHVLISQLVEGSGLGYYATVNNILLSDKKMGFLLNRTSIYKSETSSVLETGFTSRRFKKPTEPNISTPLELASEMVKLGFDSLEHIQLAMLHLQDGFLPSLVMNILRGGKDFGSGEVTSDGTKFDIGDILAGINFSVGGD